MPRVESFTVCHSIRKPLTAGAINRAKVLTDYYPSTIPGVLAKATVISLWNLACKDEARDHQATLVVKAPGRGAVSFQMSLSRNEPRVQTIREVLGIPLEEAGPLLFELLLNGKTVASHIITIHAPDSANSPAGLERSL
jgi:hypothetical protein